MTDPVRFEMRMPQQLRDELERTAAASGGRSVGSLARELIAKGLNDPLNGAERATFGHDAVRSPISGVPYEQGVGAHSPELQDRIAEAELKAGRKLQGWEVARLIRGVTIEDEATDALRGIEELKP